MGMRFNYSGRSDTHQDGFLFEILEVGRPAQSHTGSETADELIDGIGKRYREWKIQANIAAREASFKSQEAMERKGTHLGHLAKAHKQVTKGTPKEVKKATSAYLKDHRK